MYSIFEELLKKHNVTAYRVSKETGITTATLTSWKQGKYVPKPDKLQKIADYFGVSLAYLMGTDIDDQKNENTKKVSPIEELDDVYFSLAKEAQECGLTEEDVETILETIKAVKRRRLKKEQENK